MSLACITWVFLEIDGFCLIDNFLHFRQQYSVVKLPVAGWVGPDLSEAEGYLSPGDGVKHQFWDLCVRLCICLCVEGGVCSHQR